MHGYDDDLPELDELSAAELDEDFPEEEPSEDVDDDDPRPDPIPNMTDPGVL